MPNYQNTPLIYRREPATVKYVLSRSDPAAIAKKKELPRATRC